MNVDGEVTVTALPLNCPPFYHTTNLVEGCLNHMTSNFLWKSTTKEHPAVYIFFNVHIG